MSKSVRPQRRQPTSLPLPWDSPGKKTGVGCHFLLQCMKVKSESEVTQSCPTLSDPMDCSLRGFSIHRVFQARVLEWVAIAFSERRTLNILNYSLLSKISPGGILRQSRLFILLIYSFISCFHWPLVLFSLFLFVCFGLNWEGCTLSCWRKGFYHLSRARVGSAVLRGMFHPECTLFTCVLPSVSVITAKRSAGGAAPEPGAGQHARGDRVCFSAALGVLRSCEE